MNSPDSDLNSISKSEFLTVCETREITPGTCTRFVLPNGNELAVYNIGGQYYAIDNLCPHKGAPLSEGAICGHIVECGLHSWQFDVRTGECLTVAENIKTFTVRESEGLIEVEVE
jgi:nitrite reductase/ring-hydroxylating ferredoxin subunit